MEETVFHLTDFTGSRTVPTTEPQHSQTSLPNHSLPIAEGCLQVIFSQRPFLPWRNADSLVTSHVESVVRRIRTNLLLFFFLIGGPANVINMAVFYRQGLADRVTLCLFSLSLADLLYLSSMAVYLAETFYLQFSSAHTIGPVVTLLTNNYYIALFGVYYVSPVLSAIIATERCLCIFNPLKFQTLLRTRNMAMIVALLSLAVFSLSFLLFFRYRVGCVHDPETGLTITTAVQGEFYKAHKDFINILDSVVFGVGIRGGSMVVVTTMTILTIIQLRKAAKWRVESSSSSSSSSFALSSSSSSSSSSFSPKEVALTRMLVGSSLFFMVCLSPLAVFHSVRLFFPQVDSGGRQQNLFITCTLVGDVFSFLNSSLNFFVYYAMGSRYRHTFWSLCGGGTKRRHK